MPLTCGGDGRLARVGLYGDAVVLLIGGYLAWRFQVEPVDDAYIVYRYVARLLQGRGLTFNDGEYVEGFTSLLWVLLVSLGSVSGVAPDVVAGVLVWASIGFTFVLMAWLLRILNVPDVVQPLVLLILVTAPTFYRTAFIGLELGLFSACVILFLCVVLRRRPPGVGQDRTWAWTVGLAGGLLFCVRPEAVAVPPLVLLLSLVDERTTGRGWSGPVRAFGVFMGMVAAISGWRLYYYGSVLPNSVVAKATMVGGASVLHDIRTLLSGGVRYAVAGYLENPMLGVLGAVMVVLILARRHQERYRFGCLVAVIVWAHMVVVANGGDWMPYHRLLNMYWPVYVGLIAVAVSEKGSHVRARRANVYVLAGIAVVGLLVMFWDVRSGRGVRSPHWAYGEIGRVLNPVWAPGDVLMAEAIGDIGYSGLSINVHDPAGLTDYRLARDRSAVRSVFGKVNWQYSLGLEPAVIVFHYWPHQDEWIRLGKGYPERYCLFLAPPPRGGRRWVYVVLRRDRIATYLPALSTIPMLPIRFEDVNWQVAIEPERLPDLRVGHGCSATPVVR
jgi:hypothetical protein